MSWKAFVNDVGFITQYPIVGCAITNNQSPIPGYLYGEINALTYVENGIHCRALIMFLTAQLQADTPQVSLKVLKLLLYLVKNGHGALIEEVRIQEMILKKATGFHGPPDEFHGNTFYENIRKMAKELLEIVFDENTAATQDKSENLGVSEMTGYGSASSSKKLVGFGYSVKTTKTVSEKVSDGLTNLVEKFLNTSDIKEEKSEIQASFLGESLPQYKPITINKEPELYPENCELSYNQPKSSPLLNKTKKTKVRKVGKPGGGWDDSDDSDETYEVIINDVSNKQSTLSVDSLENRTKQDLQSTMEWIDEHQVVNDFTINESLETLQCENIDSSCKRCASLNCDKILSFLIDKLTKDEENVKLRALVFIEYLLHNDVVTLESLERIVLPPLLKESLTPKSVQTKSRKISLIIQSLCNYQRQHLQTSKLVSDSPAKCTS